MVYAADIHVLSVFVNSFFILSFVLFFLFFVFCFSGEGGGRPETGMAQEGGVQDQN